MFNPSTPNPFAASPLSIQNQSQQQQLSPNQNNSNLYVYGDPVIASPHRRINRRNL